MAAPAWIIAAKLIPRWLFECCDRPQPSVLHITPRWRNAVNPPQPWWSPSTTCTARVRKASGMWSKAVTHMLVLRGIGVCSATWDMPSMPWVGSSRYSRSTARSFSATRIDVSTDQAAFDLEDRHAETLGETLGLLDQLFGGERLAPFVIAGLFEEEVRRERHSAPRRTAQQVVHRSAGGLADQVQ